MNNQGGAFSNGAVLPFEPSGRAPALTGLGEVAFGRPVQRESRFDVNEIWRILAKWWWLIAAIALACLLAAIAISLMITPEYRARATIEVNPEGTQVVQMGELQSLERNDREFINTQAGLLRSRALAERVARSANLANNENFIDQELPRQTREAMAASMLESNVTVDPQRDARLISIAVESSDPQLAARVANSYVENFIQHTLERRFEATSYARTALQQRIAAVKARLE